VSTHPCFKRFVGVASTGRETGGTVKHTDEGGGEGGGRREGSGGRGRVLTELINELALRDKA